MQSSVTASMGKRGESSASRQGDPSSWPREARRRGFGF